MQSHNMLANPRNPAPVLEATDSETREGTDIGLLHVNAGLLVERYLKDRDPCVAIWVSRQFRLISDNPAMPDAELKVLYRTLAARWHQIATQSLLETHPGNPWLDEFPEEALA